MPERRILVFLTLALLSYSTPSLAAVDPALLAGMKARSIGPAGMSGRIADVQGVPSDPRVYYIGAATGGIWKSMDGGLTWKPIFDDQPVHSIGALAVNPSHPDIVWAGTGEAAVRNSVSMGNGVYKGLDAGRTWSYMGLPESERISRIRLDPNDPSVAYVAVMGKLWGDSPERGVYKTTDGGATWQKILYVNERTGAADLEMDPTNPNKLFAAMYEFRRWPWFFKSGGSGSGLYVTRDSGKHWKRLNEDDGLPAGELGRIGIAVAPSDPSIVYALMEAKENAFLRSTDGGVTWKNTGAKRGFGNRPFYYTQLRVDPERSNRVYSLWSMVSVTEDAGKTWRTLIPYTAIHPDHHAMWINPKDGNLLIEGNDGGAGMSFDRGETWRFVGNLPLAQFYHIAVDDDVPYHVYGGLQDNGCWRGPSSVWENEGIRNYHWDEVDFGDGFDTRPYPKDSMQGYSMSQQGYLTRWNLHTGERRSIRPVADAGDTLRFNWNSGFAMDPFDSETIYYGSQYLHKSTDRGETWTRLSGDLTSDNTAWQQQIKSGGLTPDDSGAENYTTIIAVAPSPLERGVIWVGTDDGRVQVTRDGGKTWTSVERGAHGVPAHSWVPHIHASTYDAGTAFVVFDDHRRSNPAPYAFRVTGYGDNWTSLITPDVRGYCLSVLQDPKDSDLLFLGTESGLFVSLDGGKRWMRWTHGVPTCSVMDIALQTRENDLVLGTHGRSVFVLDDITPLRTLDDKVTAEKLHLFTVRPAQQYQVKQTAGGRFFGATEFRGENRAYGALLTFWAGDPTLPHPDDKVERERKEAKRAKPGKAEKPAPAAAAGDTTKGGGDEGAGKGPKAKIVLRDAMGNKIRSFERPVKQGLNRVVWNLQRDPFKTPSSGFEEGDEEGREGIEVVPGAYQLEVKLKDQTAKGTVVVVPDPRVELSAEERKAAWDAEERGGKLIETLNAAAKRLDATKKDIDFVTGKIQALKADRNKDADQAETPPKNAPKDSLDVLMDAAKKIQKRVGELSKQLQRPRDAKGFTGERYILGDLRESEEFLTSTWSRPSPTVLEYLNQAEHRLAAFLQEFNAFYEKDVPAFRQQVSQTLEPFLPDEKPLEITR
jgi:photosystem II stability/assembly factor-like uncharacterized protein